MTTVLAIDCATSRTGLALVKGGEVVAEICWLTRHNQTVEMYPRLDALLKDSGIGFKEIDALAVTKGRAVTTECG